MKPKEKKEYESITDSQDRAKWLIKKGVVAKLVINPETQDVSYAPTVLGTIIPAGGFVSQLEAISAGNAWLAEKAGINSAQKGGDTEDSAVCPECMKTHHAVYHDEEPCDECCDKILLDNAPAMASPQTPQEHGK